MALDKTNEIMEKYRAMFEEVESYKYIPKVQRKPKVVAAPAITQPSGITLEFCIWLQKNFNILLQNDQNDIDNRVQPS